ncbi:MAG TPA: DUF2149 domain-containing protein [Methylosinus sp.]|jgi:hypothetical protein|uniref:DUF2149 domain-containing protein n=1 Tax=Methylosinus sp. TaxID=427 RepID=UPI002F94EEDF
MRFVHHHRLDAYGPAPGDDEDPLAGVANLFDVSVAFIVALLIALFTLFSGASLLDPKSEMTLVKTDADGAMEIISKTKEAIKIQKVTDKTLSGQGSRLGVAYQLPNGQIVYVPETVATPTGGALQKKERRQ